MSKIARNTPILFTKNEPKNMDDQVALIYNVEQEDNFYTSLNEHSLFRTILADFGIDSIVYYGDHEEPMLKGCEYEIRITPYILTKYHKFDEDDETAMETVNNTRFRLYYDAWYGRGNIFSGQVDPQHPIGINFTERLYQSVDDKVAFFIDQVRTRCEHLPEKGKLEDLTPYVQPFSLTEGRKISDYQIRLMYNDPYAHFWDLVSAFHFINQGLEYFFDFKVDEG